MKCKITFHLLVATVFISSVSAHDLFLKLDSFFVKVNEKSRLAF
jgi:hypothetical protein